MRVTDDVNWTSRGACLQIAPDDLFVQGAAQRSARTVEAVLSGVAELEARRGT